MGTNLRKYLEIDREAFGCIADYETAIGGNCAHLAGHYQSMVEDLIRYFGGPRAVLELIDAVDRVEAIRRSATEEATP